MKIVQGMQQGSSDWLQFRATRFGSSEAAAMLGLSPHCTRSELLRLKHFGLGKEFGDWFQRNVLDKGHAVEAATRPMIEAQIDDMLYPATVQGPGRLVGSCDGLTLDGGMVWECKQWNEALAAEVAAGRVSDTHMPQCQHLLLVTGADRLRFTVSDGDGRIVSIEVLPSPEWFQRLRDGWAQFERDLAAYVPPPAADPAPVGKAPDALPALRIELTGQVTASNLAEFKATALAAIRGVNRELKTDADFADAEKAVKWCADVEVRLKAAKEHALSQTASIDELFKTLDDIAAESKAARLDLDKLVTRRKTEVKEEAVTAARAALDLHIAAVNAEIAPMRLQPVAADFAGAIKGKRSIDSMQDALDTLLAGAKIAADAQGRAIRANVQAFKAATGDDRALQALFADLGQLVHKAADDFAVVVDARIAKHRADQAERERKAAEQRAAEIAAAEERAREQERARLAAEQQQREEAAAQAQRDAAAAELKAAQRKPEGAELSPAAQALNEAQGAQRFAAAHPVVARQFAAPAATAANEPATLTLGMICERLQFTVRADFLADVLHVSPAKVEGKRPGTYTESQFQVICSQLQSHISAMGELYAQQKAALTVDATATDDATRQAVARALQLAPGDTEAAVSAVAQAMGLPVEAVREAMAEGEPA